MEWRHLKPMGDVGVVVPVPFSPKDTASVRRVIAGSDIVINLIGKVGLRAPARTPRCCAAPPLPPQDYETKHYLPWLINSSYHEVNVRIPELIAKISVEEVIARRRGAGGLRAPATTLLLHPQGVGCLLHMSALASDPNSESVWARTKAEVREEEEEEGAVGGPAAVPARPAAASTLHPLTRPQGEEAVRAAAPGATLLRPADVFGPEDRLTNRLASMHALLPRLPLVDGGLARLQPLYVNDLALAVFRLAMVRVLEGGGGEAEQSTRASPRPHARPLSVRGCGGHARADVRPRGP